MSDELITRSRATAAVRHALAKGLEPTQYIDELEAEQAVRLPCRPGDRVWGIKKFNHYTFRALKGTVSQMQLTEDLDFLISVRGICLGRWGEKVFGTREDALEGLRKIREGLRRAS